MALIFRFIISSGSKNKEARYACLSEAKASHLHKMWTEISSSVPHFLQVGLLLNPVTTLDCVLLKESNLAFEAGLGTKFNFQACL